MIGVSFGISRFVRTYGLNAIYGFSFSKSMPELSRPRFFFISGLLWLQQVFVFYESLSSLRVLFAQVSLDVSINPLTDFPPRTAV
jgi:hypothetical protein